MIALSKRWENRAQRWRSPASVFTPVGFSVDVIKDNAAKPFVERHHYAGTFPAARLSVGLFGARSQLVGVAVFSQPMTQAVAPKYLGTAGGCELGRFVLLPSVAFNGESWFLARAHRLLQGEKGCDSFVSYADPVERRAGSVVVKPAHWGVIYQASNALFLGRSCSRMQISAPDGRIVSHRALSKLRNEERGWRYAESQLLSMGAPHRDLGETLRAWADRAVRSPGFARRRHPGNLIYAFPLTKHSLARLRTMHGAGLPYPERIAA